jgi:hypothetical protein
MGKIVQNGLVCFFDILGYKNILENNDINECARIINDILVEIPKNIKTDLIPSGDKLPEAYKKLAESRKNFFDKFFYAIMVSDSIVLFFDFTNINEADVVDYTWLSICYILSFQKEYFVNGFPMRGCLDFGEYYYNNNVFAGKAIVNSYNEGNSLEFSGIVITDKAYEYIKPILGNHELYQKYFNNYIFRYLSPVKQGKDELKYIIKWCTENDLYRIRKITQ